MPISIDISNKLLLKMQITMNNSNISWETEKDLIIHKYFHISANCYLIMKSNLNKA